ncbi:MAG TPA: hypothetical protein VN047_09210 [Sphingopyxis sp.]|uniref:hypothetical protein n=1 Tax=Sphingopyxis sp. TaxID=1908224 RepID=UPI002B554C88|nr:hypothetical protein [Sphingopyxis sp.]HWW57058.1 hypothetical protein [Sphingopyxis sp.]
MLLPLRALLLASIALPLPAAAQSAPPTPNQSATESRREVENSRRESRENLERGLRGEIDPREVRRAREAGATGSSVVTPEVIARWQGLAPQQLGADPDFVRAMQNDDPAALAHWEGVLIEMNRDLRADAGSRRWMGGPVLVPDHDTLDINVADRRRQPPPARKTVKRKLPEEERQDEAPRRDRNPMQERDALERDLLEARRQYDDAMRRRDDDPGNQDLVRIVEREEARVRLAEERYQAFLRENAPNEYRARQQALESIDRRATNPRQRDRSELPRRAEPAERQNTPPLSDYDGRRGTNPDHRLRGTPEGGDGPVMPGRADTQPPAERPNSPPLQDYGGRRGTNPDHRLRGTPEGDEGPVMPGRANQQPSPQRPVTPELKDYQPPAPG